MSTVHVVPLRDSIDHLVPGGLDGHDDAPGPWLCIEADRDAPRTACPCRPTAEFLGPGQTLLTHHSLDGRELSEVQA